MGIIHFLNVDEGDCTWIQHATGHNTLVDISCGEPEQIIVEHASGNYNQKTHPVNPVDYLKGFEVREIFRFILTHPDMDHMDGIKSLFDSFSILNFWDTENNKIMSQGVQWGKYSKEDWDFYQELRKSKSSPKVLHLYAGAKGKYFNQNENGQSGSDGLYLLAPTQSLVDSANENNNYNDCSYVILYRTGNRKIILSGDSEEKTWNYILENHEDDVANIDVLIAPHHGRATGGNDTYLDTLKPKLTLFGNAKSKFLDYNSWNNRGLYHITNNQANCVILNPESSDGIEIYVTNKKFAEAENSDTFYNSTYKAWYLKTI